MARSSQRTKFSNIEDFVKCGRKCHINKEFSNRVGQRCSGFETCGSYLCLQCYTAHRRCLECSESDSGQFEIAQQPHSTQTLNAFGQISNNSSNAPQLPAVVATGSNESSSLSQGQQQQNNNASFASADKNSPDNKSNVDSSNNDSDEEESKDKSGGEQGSNSDDEDSEDDSSEEDNSSTDDSENNEGDKDEDGEEEGCENYQGADASNKDKSKEAGEKEENTTDNVQRQPSESSDLSVLRDRQSELESRILALTDVITGGNSPNATIKTTSGSVEAEWNYNLFKYKDELAVVRKKINELKKRSSADQQLLNTDVEADSLPSSSDVRTSPTTPKKSVHWLGDDRNNEDSLSKKNDSTKGQIEDTSQQEKVSDDGDLITRVIVGKIVSKSSQQRLKSIRKFLDLHGYKQFQQEDAYVGLCPHLPTHEPPVDKVSKCHAFVHTPELDPATGKASGHRFAIAWEYNRNETAIEVMSGQRFWDMQDKKYFLLPDASADIAIIDKSSFNVILKNDGELIVFIDDDDEQDDISSKSSKIKSSDKLLGTIDLVEKKDDNANKEGTEKSLTSSSSSALTAEEYENQMMLKAQDRDKAVFAPVELSIVDNEEAVLIDEFAISSTELDNDETDCKKIQADFQNGNEDHRIYLNGHVRELSEFHYPTSNPCAQEFRNTRRSAAYIHKPREGEAEKEKYYRFQRLACIIMTMVQKTAKYIDEEGNEHGDDHRYVRRVFYSKSILISRSRPGRPLHLLEILRTFCNRPIDYFLCYDPETRAVGFLKGAPTMRHWYTDRTSMILDEDYQRFDEMIHDFAVRHGLYFDPKKGIPRDTHQIFLKSGSKPASAKAVAISDKIWTAEAGPRKFLDTTLQPRKAFVKAIAMLKGQKPAVDELTGAEEQHQQGIVDDSKKKGKTGGGKKSTAKKDEKPLLLPKWTSPRRKGGGHRGNDYSSEGCNDYDDRELNNNFSHDDFGGGRSNNFDVNQTQQQGIAAASDLPRQQQQSYSANEAVKAAVKSDSNNNYLQVNKKPKESNKKDVAVDDQSHRHSRKRKKKYSSDDDSSSDSSSNDDSASSDDTSTKGEKKKSQRRRARRKANSVRRQKRTK